MSGRLTVLLVIGLLICLQHLPPPKADKNASIASATPHKLVWLQSIGQNPRLYLLPAANVSLATLYAALNLQPPVIDEPIRELASHRAYLLQSNRQAIEIPLPVTALPLIFQAIPINSATVDSLCIIPGIGKQLAMNIINYRNDTGPFLTKMDLLKIKGIGKKKMLTIARNVTFAQEKLSVR